MAIEYLAGPCESFQSDKDKGVFPRISQVDNWPSLSWNGISKDFQQAARFHSVCLQPSFEKGRNMP